METTISDFTFLVWNEYHDFEIQCCIYLICTYNYVFQDPSNFPMSFVDIKIVKNTDLLGKEKTP